MTFQQKISWVILSVCAVGVAYVISTMRSDVNEVETFCEKAALLYLKQYPEVDLDQLEVMKAECKDYYIPDRGSPSDVRIEGF